jgi:hypothetical protein
VNLYQIWIDDLSLNSKKRLESTSNFDFINY